jgi:soluble lytic murein transglycosylase
MLLEPFLLSMNFRRFNKIHLHHPLLSGVIALSLTLFIFPLQQLAAATPETSLSQQRALFQTARDALKNGRHAQYQKLARQLQEYPLYPYLEYWRISQDLSKADSATVENFLTQYADTPLANRLRLSWLDQLAKQEQWPQFITFYTPNKSAELECYYRRALYKIGDKQAAFKDMEKLWLTADALPRVCDPLFSAWREAGVLNEEMVWRRVELIMREGDIYEARALEPYLSKAQRHWSKLWREVHLHPENALTDQQLKENTPINRAILAHGVRRLARLNPLMAAEAWNKLIMEYGFSEEEFNRTEAQIALALARAKAPEAMKWLTNLSAHDNPAVREWRVLTAINQGKWDEALLWMNQLTADEQRNERWQYWRARAFEATGKPERARPAYVEAAKNRDYYGFMAAERIGVPYEFEDKPLQFPAAEMEAARALPAVQRVREFYALGDISNARREWLYLIQQGDKTTQLKAARLAHEFGWHDRAIFALGRADYMDDLEIRFPLAHREQVVNNANVQKIDPSWAFAIIRQESSFASDARSPVGALGLMQIMPNTGKVIAKDLSTRLRESSQLLDIDTNIRFGISYLRKMLNRFDQNTALATAAYNAGSQRVKGWLPKDENMEPDLWVENIPFKETRHYVKQVLAFAAIYDARMTRPVTPIKQRMPLIQASVRDP